ncbi:MAG: Hsp20/alpha crystallin family protein [Minisyncoccia bacterium]
MNFFKKQKPEKNKFDLKQTFQKYGELAVDVFQTEKEFVILAPVAGVDIQDLETTIENNVLILKGERKNIFEEENKVYIKKEIFWGPFLKKIILPKELDLTKINAQLFKGFIVIKIPKKEILPQNEIKVKIKP